MTNVDVIKKRKPVYSDIHCTCGKLFTPLTSGNKKCSWECRFKAIYESAESVDGCTIWPKSPGSHGYGQFTADGVNTTSHTTSYRYHKGTIPSGMVVMHSCDNRMCINPEHLSLGTQSENLKDMWRKGRQRPASAVVRGDDHPNSRFTDEKKKHILETYSHLSTRAAALELGCEKTTIARIRRLGSSNGSALKSDLLAAK